MNEFNYDDSAYLAHHGVKGMKWGVRKDRNSYLSNTRARRTSEAIKSRIKKSSFSRGDEKYVRLDKFHAVAANKPAYKATLKRKLKRIGKGAAIGAGVAAGATAIGLGINAARKKKNNGYSQVNDPILNNIRQANPVASQSKMDAVMQYRRAKDIQNQMKRGRGINYI